MNKKKSIVVLCIVSVFIILMAVFAFVSFPIAGTVYDYTGYAKTIKLGLDMSGGVSAVFKVVPDEYENLDNRISGTISSLQSLLVSKGYTEATVTKGRPATVSPPSVLKSPTLTSPNAFSNLSVVPHRSTSRLKISATKPPLQSLKRRHSSADALTLKRHTSQPTATATTQSA